MNRSRSVLAIATVAMFGLAACTGSSAGPSAAASSQPSFAVVAASASAVVSTPIPPSPSPSVEPSPSAGGGGGGTPAIEPCKLLTTKQASDVNKTSYPAGVAHAFGDRGVECVWQTKTASVVVQVLVAPNTEEATTAYVEAEARAKGFQVTDIPNFADKAAIARAPIINGGSTGGIYVRDGTTFFDVVYVFGKVPTDNELKFAATLVLGNLP